jgi:hypothetical protein
MKIQPDNEKKYAKEHENKYFYKDYDFLNENIKKIPLVKFIIN